MPSPDGEHTPRWWIAVTTGYHGGMATKDQRRIDVIPGATNLPYFNKVLISSSPFVAVATWLDWCKLRDFDIPNKLTLVSWVEDTIQQRLRLGNKVINIFNRDPHPHSYIWRPTRAFDSFLERSYHKSPGCWKSIMILQQHRN